VWNERAYEIIQKPAPDLVRTDAQSISHAQEIYPIGFVEAERQEGMTRKQVRRRKGIVTTRRAPKWKRNVQAAVKGFKSQAKSALAAAGFVWLLMLLADYLGGG
jgi:hypothetical protein